MSSSGIISALVVNDTFLIWTLARVIVLSCVIGRGKLLSLHRGAYLHSVVLLNSYWQIVRTTITNNCIWTRTL